MILRQFFAQIGLIAARTGTVPRQNRYSAGDPVHAAITNFYFMKVSIGQWNSIIIIILKSGKKSYVA